MMVTDTMSDNSHHVDSVVNRDFIYYMTQLVLCWIQILKLRSGKRCMLATKWFPGNLRRKSDLPYLNCVNDQRDGLRTPWAWRWNFMSGISVLLTSVPKEKWFICLCHADDQWCWVSSVNFFLSNSDQLMHSRSRCWLTYEIRYHVTLLQWKKSFTL